MARVGLEPDDLVVDLGCGTDQLAIPLSSRVRHVLAIDPAPDQLAHGHSRAGDLRANVSWMIGTDADITVLPQLLGDGAVTAVTISNAIHLMNAGQLIRRLNTFLPSGGSVPSSRTAPRSGSRSPLVDRAARVPA